jgi:hypothetical protein
MSGIEVPEHALIGGALAEDLNNPPGIGEIRLSGVYLGLVFLLIEHNPGIVGPKVWPSH